MSWVLEKLPSLEEVTEKLEFSREDVTARLPLVSAVTVAVASVGTYLYLKNKHRYWRKRGIDGPEPSFPFGTSISGRSTHDYMMEREEKYGKIYGTYAGFMPVLIVADARVVKEALVENFSKFTDRRATVSGPPASRSLINLNGEDWKKDRAIMSQTFSSGKMKQMYPLMRECYIRLDLELKKIAEKGEQVDIKSAFSKLTTMVIARCAFAIEVDAFTDPENELLKRLQGSFKFSRKRIMAHTLLPDVIKRLIGFSLKDPACIRYIASVCRKVLDHRKKEQNQANNYTDLLQLLMDTDKKGEGFSDSKIIANSISFFSAGYETTSTLLTWVSYALATNPDVQEKLHEEAKRAKDEKGEFDYETLFDLKYLDAVINETLRMYPPVPAYDRVCTEDHKFENGLEIQKGCTIRIHAYSLHNSPDYWEEPEKFNPSRFMPENRDSLVQGAFVPFVIGRRNCIGMRFALLETKMTLAELMCSYKFVRSEGTPAKAKFDGSPILAMRGYKVKVVQRD